jgi:NAD(P)H dehydrogenase (quinone)
MADKLLVTGASGHLGRLVLDKLLERGIEAGSIIATTRDPAKLADYAAKGVEVRKADFDDTANLVEAFKGASRLALISTDALDDKGTRRRQHVNAVEAAKAAGVKHIVYTSMPNPTPDAKVLFAPDHRLTEEAIKASGLSYTILRNTWYQENQFMSLPSVLKSGGQWYTSTGEGKVAFIARADCADAIAAVLASGTTESATYTLTGAESFTSAEVAVLASDVLGTPVTVVQLTDEQLAGGMKQHGVPDFLIPMLISFEAAIRLGQLSDQTSDLEKLTGRKPTSFRSFFENNKAALLA